MFDGCNDALALEGLPRREVSTSPRCYRAITVHVAPTREAVRIYNELAETTTVGGLFHSTC